MVGAPIPPVRVTAPHRDIPLVAGDHQQAHFCRMYQLQVLYPADPVPVERVYLTQASEVLSTIPELLARHERCETVVVLLGSTRLFAVDCKGNRLPN